MTMICSAVAVIGFSDSSDAASEGDAGDVHWVISGDTLTIGGTGEIPDYGEGGPDEPRPPWEQGDGWGNVKNVVIQSGVTRIGTYTFFNFHGLRSISLPNTLTHIGNSAFFECSGLPTITIPNSVTDLGSSTFVKCDSLASVVFEGNVGAIHDYTFDYTPSLHVVYHNDDSVNMDEWPAQNILFINTKGGSTTGPILDPDNGKFPGEESYTAPASETFCGYKNSDTDVYYVADDYTPRGKVKVDVLWDTPIPSYNVSVYYVNLGHGTAPPAQTDFLRGTNADEPDPLTAEGYRFDGWCLRPNGTQPWDFNHPVYRTTILYAKWVKELTVTFDAGHGTAPASVSVDKGLPVEKPADPVVEGYTFGGWYKERTCQTKWNFDDPVTGDMTLYAKWDVQQFKVIFDMMGHGLGPDVQIVNYNDMVTKPADISIEGYTFGGWYKEMSFNNEWNFDSDVVKTDTVLYAKWVSNSSGGNNGATVPVWALTSVIAGSVVFVGAAILLLRRH